MLLYPDMSRDQHTSETFCFAAPCTKDEWYRMYRSSMCVKDGIRMPYVMLSEDGEQAVIILRGPEVPDSSCVETAAWIRITLPNFNGMIYAMKYAPTVFTSVAATIARTAGANPRQVKHFDLSELT